jgi:hypothetical protein
MMISLGIFRVKFVNKLVLNENHRSEIVISVINQLLILLTLSHKSFRKDNAEFYKKLCSNRYKRHRFEIIQEEPSKPFNQYWDGKFNPKNKTFKIGRILPSIKQCERPSDNRKSDSELIRS